jgi:poly(hydroxyalkanoate) polymerase-like protein
MVSEGIAVHRKAVPPRARRQFLRPAPALPIPTEQASDELAVDAARADTLDRFVHAWQGRFTQSLSPSTLLLAYLDWFAHIVNAPGKRGMLVEKALRKWTRLLLYAAASAGDPEHPPCIEPLPQDRRFTAPEWQQPPFNLIYPSIVIKIAPAITALSRTTLLRPAVLTGKRGRRHGQPPHPECFTRF